MRASFKRLRVESSGVAAPLPSSTSETTTEESVDPVAAVAVTAILAPSTLDDSDIQRMLETVMTVQAAHGQLLVDMLDELRALRVDLELIRRSPPPPPFEDE